MSDPGGNGERKLPPAQDAVSQEQLARFAQLIKWLREARGWSLRDAGERTDLSYGTIRSMEEGQEDGRYTVPSIWTLMRVSEGYGVALPIITKAAYGVGLDIVGVPDILPQVYQKLHEAAEILAKHMSEGELESVAPKRQRGRRKRSEELVVNHFRAVSSEILVSQEHFLAENWTEIRPIN